MCAAGIAALLVAAVAAAPASALPSSDPLHGGSGEGLTVVGHSDLGGTGLNGEVAVLGNYAFVGMGINGGFAAQWARTPKCNATTTVKVVNLTDPANPAVTSTIDLTVPGEDPGATIGRSLAPIKVKSLSPANSAFTGDLRAVALESRGGGGRLGVNFYDVTIRPRRPVDRDPRGPDVAQ